MCTNLFVFLSFALSSSFFFLVWVCLSFLIHFLVTLLVYVCKSVNAVHCDLSLHPQLFIIFICFSWKYFFRLVFIFLCITYLICHLFLIFAGVSFLVTKWFLNPERKRFRLKTHTCFWFITIIISAVVHFPILFFVIVPSKFVKKHLTKRLFATCVDFLNLLLVLASSWKALLSIWSLP